jgi:hypothetical protein
MPRTELPAPAPILRWLIAGCFLAALTTLPSTALSDGPDRLPSGGDREAEIARHLQGLGSDSWGDREAATAALLEIGPDAIPALRVLDDRGDPEIRSRIDWLLETLLPPYHILELIRLQGSPLSMVPTDWARTAVRLGERIEATLATPEGPGRRFTAEVARDGDPPSLRIEEITTRIGFELSAPATPGRLVVLERESEFELDVSRDRRELTRESALWVARIVRTEGEPEFEPLGDLAEVEALLEQGITLGFEDGGPVVLRDAARVAVALGRGDRVPPIDELPAAGRLPVALARGQERDADSLAELSAALSAHQSGLDRLEMVEASEVAVVLTASGATDGLPLLLDQFDEAPFYWQHRTASVLLDRMEEPAFVAAHGEAVLESLISPAKVDGIPFENGVVSSLLIALEEKLPAEVFARHFTKELSITLGDPRGSGSSRARLMLGLLHRLLLRSPIPAEVWVEPVLDMLGSNIDVEILSLLLGQRAAGKVDDETWATLTLRLQERLAVDESSPAFAAWRALQRIEAFGGFDPEGYRRFWLGHLVVFEGGDSPVRGSIDQALVDRFGRLDERRPTGKEESWEKRGAAWRGRIEGLPADKLRPMEADGGTRLRMTIAHLRPTPLGEPNELVRCSSLTLLPNELHLEIGPNLEDRSVYLEPYGAASQRMYRQLHGAAINVGRPIRRNQNPYWRTIRYVAAEGRLGLTSLARDGSSPFDTIFYLEELTVPADPPTDESGEGAPAESTQAGADGALEPAEGDDDATLYSKMIGRMLAQLPEARYSRDILSLIGDLRLEEALPFLTVRWEESPEDLDLARTLLLLGDTSGQQRLLTAVEEEDRFALQILVSLVDSGVVEALEPAIEWLTGGGPPRGGTPLQLLQALDRGIESEALRPHIAEERWLGILIELLENRSLQNSAVRSLRDRTGIDHGYFGTFEISDTKERLEAQEECFQLWRDWWRKQQPTTP